MMPRQVDSVENIGEFSADAAGLQPDSQPSAPSRESAAVAARNRGWFTSETGKAASTKSGLYSRPETSPALVEEMQGRARSILADRGVSEVDAAYVEASQVRDFVRIEMLIESGFAHLAGLAKGGRPMTTGKGYTRKVADRLVSYIAAKQRLAQQLGLERRQKPTESVRDLIA